MKRPRYRVRQMLLVSTLMCTASLFMLPLESLAQQRNAFAPALARSDSESIAINTQLVSLQVSVTDKEGRFIAGLEPDRFAIYEDGVRQEISYFSDQDTPATIGIVLDVSGSMTDEKIRHAREALARFIQTSHEEDEYFLVGFNDHAQTLLAGVRGTEALLARVAAIKPQGNTALYDAVALGLAQVAYGHFSKRALLVISDGEDNHSRLDFGQVRKRLREADVTIYTILIGPLLPRSSGGAIMQNLASASGGKSYFPSNAEKMSEAFEQIALELRSQYSVGYVPTNLSADGRWRRIKIKVTLPDALPRLIVRSRKGYFAITNY